jgi:hypothetical protein
MNKLTANLIAVKCYQQTKKGKEVNRKATQCYQQSEKGKATRRRYQQSTQVKDAQRRYNQSEKGKARNKRCYNQYPNRRKARNAVNNAIFVGKMPNIESRRCYFCFEQAKYYHHYKGYKLEFQLDVIPVCGKCYRTIHKEIA